MNVKSNKKMREASGLILVTFALLCFSWNALANTKTVANPPNILFIILDDVGIDQMEMFGYGGITPPQIPSIEAIANDGLSFRNFWAMPECSPSRALMFEGRYPMRTHVTNAILSVDLANSQVSPYETTTPKILKEVGYENALFGKFHLTGSNVNATGEANNPLDFTAVYQLGWDYFAGWQDGAPHPIDTTAGGVAPDGVSYACGFVPNASSENGANTGACYYVDDSCEEISIVHAPTPGRACMEKGGIFDPGTTCQSQAPAKVDFTLQNAYYAGELVINNPDGSFEVIEPEDPSGAGRGYRTSIESDRAIEWINSRPANTPWMASLSFSSAHTPYQQPPTSLLGPGSTPTGGFDCLDDIQNQRVLSNQMIESMDTEIARVLVETGIATLNNGVLEYDPAQSNVMIVVLGDNGTYAPGIKGPFNPERSKGTVYQSGVWTPLIVAGPLVNTPGREVTAMVNIADVFELFGEIAGVDVHQVVPKARPIDSVSMLPYLQNPLQTSLRKNNFAQSEGNIKKEGFVVQPCVLAAVNACIQLFPSQALCASEGGEWWGDADGSQPPLPLGPGAPVADCCGVNEYQVANDLPKYNVLADWQMALRNDDYKLVRLSMTDWDETTSECATTEFTEFYAIDEAKINPQLDNKNDNLLLPPNTLTPQQTLVYKNLNKQLDDLLASDIACPGDGNKDGVVDFKDISDLGYWANTTGSKSSWFDFNLDGLTDDDDIPFITQTPFPRTCVMPAIFIDSFES